MRNNRKKSLSYFGGLVFYALSLLLTACLGEGIIIADVVPIVISDTATGGGKTGEGTEFPQDTDSSSSADTLTEPTGSVTETDSDPPSSDSTDFDGGVSKVDCGKVTYEFDALFDDNDRHNESLLYDLNGVTHLKASLRISMQDRLLPDFSKLRSLRCIDGMLIIENSDAIEHLEFFMGLKRIRGGLVIKGNQNLRSINDLNNIASFDGVIGIYKNSKLSDCDVKDFVSVLLESFDPTKPYILGVCYDNDNAGGACEAYPYENACPIPEQQYQF